MLAFDTARAADDKPSAETTPEKQRHHSPTEVAVESAGLEAETKAAPEDAPENAHASDSVDDNPEICVFEVGAIVFDHVGRVALLQVKVSWNV